MQGLLAEPVKTPSEEENAKAFSIAKEALALISTFRTPPIPEVYEVWYRYVEGGNKAIQDQLTHSVKVAKSVSASRLQELKRQFLNSSDSAEVNHSISQKLAKEMDGLHKLISSQQGVNEEFGGSIASASDRLIEQSDSSMEMRTCLSEMLLCKEKMTASMAEMDLKLKTSKGQVESLKETLAEMQKSILIDPLTGLGNRRVFDATLAVANEPRTNQKPTYLFLVDLDEFKTINDTHGHLTGDDVLRFVGQALVKQAIGATITRYGGDEFAIFVNVEPEQAKQMADNICNYFFGNDLTVRSTGNPLGKLTISLGGALLRTDDNSDSWFERADKLLYDAKCGGRNRVMVERARLN